MNCSSCGAPLTLAERQDYLTCLYCGCIAVPEPDDQGVRVLGEPSGESCPQCATGLVHAAIDHERILYCSHCGGMLVNMATFAALVADLRSRRDRSSELFVPVDEDALRRRIECPQCRRVMDTHVYEAGGNVVISDCERCEVNWLPHGGLDRIVRAPDYHYGAAVKTIKGSW